MSSQHVTLLDSPLMVSTEIRDNGSYFIYFATFKKCKLCKTGIPEKKIKWYCGSDGMTPQNWTIQIQKQYPHIYVEYFTVQLYQ
jgi:hypothetical protein